MQLRIPLIPPGVSVHSATYGGFTFADLSARCPLLGRQAVSDQGCRLRLWGFSCEASSYSAAPDEAARTLSPPARVLRKLSPVSSIRWAWWTRRSKIA